jgi:GPH family glycoside/pentoside/hexuronide:cation symporter
MSSTPLPRRVIILWALGTLASTLLISMFGQLNQQLPLEFKISPVVLGIALMLPRLLDAAIDPWLGHWSDHLRTRWGRRKPFVAVGALVGAVSMALLWWIESEWPVVVQYIWLIGLGTLFYTAWGTFQMAHTSLGWELSDDSAERSRIQAWSGLFQYVGWILVSLFWWLSLQPVFSSPGVGMRLIAIAFAIIILACACGPLLGCQERFAQHRPKESHAFWSSIRHILGHRAYRVMLGYRILSGILGLGATATVIYGLFAVCGGDKSQQSLIAPITQVFLTLMSMMAIVAIPWVSRRFEKRTALIASSALALVMAILAPLCAVPGQPYLQLLPMFLVMPVKILMDVQVNAIYPDICDLDEWEHGERREGLLTAVMAQIGKVEMSLLSGVGGYLLAATGYVGGGEMPDVDTLHRMAWLAYAPGIGASVALVLIALRYPLNREFLQRIRTDLDQRRKAATTP